MLPIAKIFTVTKNETDLIESFILYHGKIFGYENIIIIDNMSTCPIVKNVYKNYTLKGVRVVYEPSYEGSSQGDAFTKYMLEYRKKAKFLIGLDTDEFFFLRGVSSTFTDIEKHLNSIPSNISKLVIVDYFSAVLNKSSRHYIDQKINNPAVNINTFNRDKISPKKCIFRANCFLSTVNGCHNGKTIGGDSRPCHLIVYFHYHHTGARRTIERAKEIIHGYGYTNTSAPLSEQFHSLMNVTSPIGSHRVLEYGLFISKLQCLQYIIQKGKWPTPDILDMVSSKFPTLLGRDIDVSHMNDLPDDWKLLYDDLLFYDQDLEPDFAHNGITNVIYEEMQPINNVLPCKPIKKVALLLSGHVRNFEPRKQFWIDFNKKFGDRVDIYIHTWNESGLRSKNEWIDVGSVPPNFDEIRDILKPKDMLIEDHASKMDSFSFIQPGLELYYTNVLYLNRAEDFTKNIGSQLYSVMKSWELANNSNIKYDMMIRLRGDCILENFNNIFTRDTSFLEDDVLIMNGNSHRHAMGGGGCSKCTLEYPIRKHKDHVCDVCDIMYLGNPKVMKKVCNMFKNARDLVKSFQGYNKLAIKDKKVLDSLVKYPYSYGVKCPIVFETKLKCFYPERLIREYMKDYWLITDMLGLVAKISY